MNRREFLKLTGIGGGIIFFPGISGLHNKVHAIEQDNEFFCIQLSDTHWGFAGPAVNPYAEKTLMEAITTVNSLSNKPDLILFTGDLTHTTDDDKERRKRLSEFYAMTNQLKVKNIRYMPGEHDAGLDQGQAYKELFGASYYTFDHKGTHFIVLDNVSAPGSSIGDTQLRWLQNVLAQFDKNSMIVVFTHRPLFNLYRDWDWDTRDGAQAVELLMPYSNVTVFYGHIHQEHHFKTGHIAHHAAKGMMYPLPAPGSVPKKAPIPWDAAHPYKGLGFRSIDVKFKPAAYNITEYSVQGDMQ